MNFESNNSSSLTTNRKERERDGTKRNEEERYKKIQGGKDVQRCNIPQNSTLCPNHSLNVVHRKGI